MNKMNHQIYAEDIEDHMQLDDESHNIYKKRAKVDDKKCGYGPKDDNAIYYLQEHIYVYEGPNLVAQIIKNHLGQTIRTIVEKPTTSAPDNDNNNLLASVTRKARTTTIERKPRRDLFLHQQQKITTSHDDDHQEMDVDNNHNDDDDDQEEEQEQEEGRGVLFIEKALRSTDVSDHHHRLSVSCKQAVNDTFLTNAELEFMKNRGAVKAILTDPAGREYDVRLQIEKTGTGNCLCYKIPKPWNQIRKDNHIKEGMIIQLWASRPNGAKLCFSLVRKPN